MTATPPALRVAVLDKSFARHNRDATQVLRDVRFAIGERELVALTGPSGCGKTTLLNLIAGLDNDFDGEIERPRRDDDELPLAYVFQEPCLLPWRTVRENVRLAVPAGVRADERIAWLLDKMNLSDAADAYPQTLSLGMSRRAALARGFAVAAPLLLLDEPFASIDERTAVRLRKLLLAQLAEMPRAVLFVTHNLREALFLGDRLLILSGRPTTLAADLPLASDDSQRGREADEISRLHREIVGKFPQILG